MLGQAASVPGGDRRKIYHRDAGAGGVPDAAQAKNCYRNGGRIFGIAASPADQDASAPG